MNKKNIAIIPARWGSKGILKKNLSILNGKPLLAYSIEAAIQSGCFDVICVISDSEEIINFALNYGIETIREPEYLAKDDTKMIDVITHVLDFYEQKNQVVEIVTLLQPTSPLRTDKHIKNAVETYFENKKYRSLVSFYEAKDHPYKSFLLLDNNDVKPTFWDEYTSIPRQLLPKVIQQNGAIYINRAEDLLRHKSFFTKPVYPFMMDEISSVDIDTGTDLPLAEFYISNWEKAKTPTNKFITNYDYSSFVFITSGAFQWKSLLSIKIAEQYVFSAILSTDCFRNILRTWKPSREILCSTSNTNLHSMNY